MNRLQKDIRSLRRGRLVVGGAFVGLGILALVWILLGLEEREFYQRYPIGWWAAVFLGLLYVAALVYCVVKTFAIDPDIQLRGKSDEEVQRILEDPEYGLWHHRARRQLAQRHSLLTGKTKWLVRFVRYAVVLLVVLWAFLRFASYGSDEDLRTKNGGFAHVAGLFLYMGTGLFIFMSSCDRMKRVRPSRFKIPLSILAYSLFCAWLLGAMIWIIYLFDF